MAAEKVRLRIGNLAKAVLVTGQAYQDPKDALNEFVSNAADEYAEAERRGERIRIVLRRKGRNPVIAIDDAGRGMGADRLREVARNLFESSKAGDTRTLGEKAIGVLAFQQLGGRCDVVSRAEGSLETWTLRLERGKATATLERERRRARTTSGTTVFLSELDPDVLRLMTQRKMVDYLRGRRGAALARGDYTIEVVEGRSAEIVTPSGPRESGSTSRTTRRCGVGSSSACMSSRTTASGDESPSSVAPAPRSSTTSPSSTSSAGPPWATDQVTGQIVFEALQQSAGRRAILRDRDAFPVFLDAVRTIEPAVARAVERVTREVDEQTADRLADAVRKIFGRVLKELADLDNPMRTPLGSEAGEGALFAGARVPTSVVNGRSDAAVDGDPTGAPPSIDDLVGTVRDPAQIGSTRGRPPIGRRSPAALPSVEPDPEPGEERSRFDAERGVVLYNDRHEDYLLVKDDEGALLDYLNARSEGVRPLQQQPVKH